ncbi:MAG: alpha-L-fucosidase [Armatimonadota bacterium]
MKRKAHETMADDLALAPEDMQWWRDAKFGMFLHWGVYAIPGRGEWVMFVEDMDVDEYRKLADRFDPKGFDARAWAKAAKDAGMKYMVLTARHHDGFSLFDSKASDFTSVKTAAKRDFVAEYCDACREAGLRVGLYYSPMDWRFPGYFFPDLYRRNALAMKEQCWTQVRELMSNYGRIDILWYDGAWLAHGGIGFDPGGRGWYQRTGGDASATWFWEPEKLNAMVRELQPKIVINPRSGWRGDFDTREGRTGEMQTGRPWEQCDTLTGTWGHIPGALMRSLRNCVQLLASVAVRDGNLLLNVGPTAEGIIEPRQVGRLAQVGEWLQRHGESIYGTRGGPFAAGGWGGSTYLGNTVYLHILDWPEDWLVLPSLQQRVVRSRSLTGTTVDVSQTEETIEVSVPPPDRDATDTIISLELEGVVSGNSASPEFP